MNSFTKIIPVASSHEHGLCKTKILDTRQKTKHNTSASNRKRFIDRHKHSIRRQVKELVNSGDIDKAGDSRDVIIKDIGEPNFNRDHTKGDRTRVLPGNKTYRNSDQINRPNKEESRGAGGGPDSELGEDEFRFTLTKEEFMDVYFSDLGLPDYVKESLMSDTKKAYKRAGYTTVGTPAKLDIKKTFEQAMARKIASKAQGNPNPRFLDDIDIRYRLYAPRPVPIKQAVVFNIMDVSGSMTREYKELAKRFYLLLFLFLEKEYESVEMVYIRHTHVANEVDEHTFFYGRETGGTRVTSAFELMKDIMSERYSPTTWNIYVCQASDGDSWAEDNQRLRQLLEEDIIPNVQYFAYVQTGEPRGDEHSLTMLYESLSDLNAKFNTAVVLRARDIYPVFRKLFSRELS